MIPDRHSTYAVSVTTFDSSGGFDENAMRAHCERLANAGMGAYLGGSAPGQGNTLSTAELGRMFEIGREAFAGKATVRAMGVEPRTPEQLIEIAKLVQSTGLDAMQVYSLDLGHGAAPNEQELEGYFRTVLDQVEVPAVLSTHQCMGWFMPHALMARLLKDYPLIGGIHVTNPDLVYMLGVLDVARASKREIEVHTGLQLQAVSALALGATGYLSGEANLFPELCLQLVKRFEAGDLAGTLDVHKTLVSLFQINLYGQGVRGLKAGMKLLGLPGADHRKPVLPLQATEEAEVAALLDSLGLLSR
jgi:4-hydroxy-tetrahydrodipicolinate synthase